MEKQNNEIEKQLTDEEKEKLREKWRANYQKKKEHLQWLKDSGVKINTEYLKVSKEKQRERTELHYERHPEKIYMYYDCECGGTYTLNHKSGHMKSKYHLKYLESLKQAGEIEIEPQPEICEKDQRMNQLYLAPIKLYVEKLCQMNDLHLCSCGASCSLNSRDWHLKTKGHLEHQESKKQTDENEIESHIIEKEDGIIPKQPEISKKEKLLEKKRIYAKMFRQNKSKQLNELHECACGGTYSMRNKARHMKSKSHLKCLVIENCDI
jgi:hypothetical protein